MKEVGATEMAQGEVRKEGANPHTKGVDLESLQKELSELKEFKAKIEAEQSKAKEAVKEHIPVMDTFTSKNETVVTQKPKTNTQKHGEEMFNKGAFYRGE